MTHVAARRGSGAGTARGGDSLAAEAMLGTSAETRGTRKNEESTSVSTSPRFDLSLWTKETVAGRWSSMVWRGVTVHGWFCVAGTAAPARDSAGQVGGSREELLGILPVRGIELWWLV